MGKEGPQSAVGKHTEACGRRGQHLNGGAWCGERGRAGSRGSGIWAESLNDVPGCGLWQNGVWDGVGRPVQEEGASAHVASQKVPLDI